MEKWPFFDQNHGLTPLEKSQFFEFLNFFFYGLERRFFLLEYFKTHFSVLCCPKRTMEKWPFFDQNHGLTPLDKSQFFALFELLVFIAQKGFFLFKNIVKGIFLACIAQKYILLTFQMDRKALQSIKMLFEKRIKIEFFQRGWSTVFVQNTNFSMVCFS